MMTIFNQFSGSSRFENKLVYSEFMAEVKAGNISKVEINDNNLTGTTAQGKKFTTYAPTDPWLVSDLLKNNVIVDAKPKQKQSLFMSILYFMVSDDFIGRSMDILYEANARWWRKRWRPFLIWKK